MSSQIAEHTIKSCYVIKVQNGHLDFILKLCAEARTLQISALLFYGLGYNKPTYEKKVVRVCEGRMLLAVFH